MKKPVIRTCCGCRRKGEKQEFFRIVRIEGETVLWDPKQKLSGRGVYLCRKLSCIAGAEKKNALHRAFPGSVIPEDLYERLKRECQ